MTSPCASEIHIGIKMLKQLIYTFYIKIHEDTFGAQIQTIFKNLLVRAEGFEPIPK